MKTASSQTNPSGRRASAQRETSAESVLRRLAGLLARSAAAELMATADSGFGITPTEANLVDGGLAKQVAREVAAEEGCRHAAPHGSAEDQ